MPSTTASAIVATFAFASCPPPPLIEISSPIVYSVPPTSTEISFTRPEVKAAADFPSTSTSESILSSTLKNPNTPSSSNPATTSDR